MDAIIYKKIICPNCNSGKHVGIEKCYTALRKFSPIPQGFAVTSIYEELVSTKIICHKCQIVIEETI